MTEMTVGRHTNYFGVNCSKLFHFFTESNDFSWTHESAKEIKLDKI